MAIFDYSLITALIVGSFLLVFGAFFYAKFVKPKTGKLTQTERKPPSKRGARVSFGGMASKATAGAAPVPFDGWILGWKTNNGKVNMTVENAVTSEVKELKGLIWTQNVRSLTANTPNEAVLDSHLLTNVDWDNGFFEWDSITVDAYRASVDRIQEDRIKNDTRKELEALLEWQNLRGQPDTVKSMDRMRPYRELPPNTGYG